MIVTWPAIILIRDLADMNFYASLLPTDDASSHLTSHYTSPHISLLYNLCSQYIIRLWISET